MSSLRTRVLLWPSYKNVHAIKCRSRVYFSFQIWMFQMRKRTCFGSQLLFRVQIFVPVFYWQSIHFWNQTTSTAQYSCHQKRHFTVQKHSTDKLRPSFELQTMCYLQKGLLFVINWSMQRVPQTTHSQLP